MAEVFSGLGKNPQGTLGLDSGNAVLGTAGYWVAQEMARAPFKHRHHNRQVQAGFVERLFPERKNELSQKQEVAQGTSIERAAELQQQDIQSRVDIKMGISRSDVVVAHKDNKLVNNQSEAVQNKKDQKQAKHIKDEASKARNTGKPIKGKHTSAFVTSSSNSKKLSHAEAVGTRAERNARADAQGADGFLTRKK